ncbi:MAG: putative LuxR-family transcriptional regulator [Candidatus Saccharibacteria bacterium]|nr:putative LuxR-family transcriptional regulator [Candidatus Saccharibacteria bacterium]
MRSDETPLGLAGEFGAGGEPFDATESPLWRLSERQGEVALRAAEGLENKEIARELGIHPFTVRTHLHHAYIRLGVHDRAHLAALLAADESKLNELNVQDIPEGRQRQMFDLIGAGLSYGQAAEQLSIDVSTARNHSNKVRGILGLKNGVELARVAHAFHEKRKAAAINLQPIVASELEEIDNAVQQRHLRLNAQAGGRVNDPALRAILYEKGYISEDMRNLGRVDLVGWIAALMSKKETVSAILIDPHTEDVAHEIIHQEVRVRLHKKTQISSECAG